MQPNVFEHSPRAAGGTASAIGLGSRADREAVARGADPPEVTPREAARFAAVVRRCAVPGRHLEVIAEPGRRHDEVAAALCRYVEAMPRAPDRKTA